MATYQINDEDQEHLDRAFVYHSPKSGQNERYQALRSKAKELGQLILEEVPFCLERENAMMFLDTVVFHANSGIARWDE